MGLPPSGSKQGLQTTARALLRDFHAGLQLRRQGGGSLALQSQEQETGGQRERGAGLFLEGQELGSLGFYPGSAFPTSTPTLGPCLHICKRSRLYLMAELLSTVFLSIHSVFISRYFLGMEMEGRREETERR